MTLARLPRLTDLHQAGAGEAASGALLPVAVEDLLGPAASGSRSSTHARSDRRPARAGDRCGRLHRRRACPPDRRICADPSGAARSLRIPALSDRPRGRSDRAGTVASRAAGRCARSRAPRRRLRRGKARAGIPCRGPEARAAGGNQPDRGHAHQCRGHPPGGGSLPWRGRGADAADLHRQGGLAHQRDGRSQARGRADLPGAGPRQRCRGQGLPFRCRALRQCAGLDRLGGAAVPAAAGSRRAAHRHRSRDDPLFHDHPRSGGAGAAGGRLGTPPAPARRRADAGYGRAGAHRRSRPPDDPPRRQTAGYRYQDRLHRPAAGREDP